MERLVGVGGCVFSSNTGDIIKTYGLSTCIAVVAYSPVRKVMGVAHIPLPYKNDGDDTFEDRPAKYAESAIPMLFETLKFRYGCSYENLNIDIFGGIKALNDNIFHIGEKNLIVARKLLNKYGVTYDDTETGGNVARSVFGCVYDGSIQLIRTPLSR